MNELTSEQDLTRSIAADLGPDVLAAIAAPPPEDATRSFGIPEAMAIGGFLVSCAQFAFTVWQTRKAESKQAQFVADLFGNEKLHAIYPSLGEEKRLGVMARIARKLGPDTFNATREAKVAGLAERQRWIAAYIEQRRAEAAAAPSDVTTRDFVGGPPLLVPFADQVYWALHKPIGWIPDESDGPNVIRVDVPRGFVTDLASVPGYLWPIMTKTGKYGNAAIYHDWLYAEQPCSRLVADTVFDRALAESGVDDVTRSLMWAAVRVFGGGGWERYAQDKAAGRKWVITKFPDDPTITWEDWRQRPDVFV